jgi:uncharacterized protein YjbJ (UPF0337 family)
VHGSLFSGTVKGDWKQSKDKVKEQWGKLTEDDLDRIEGRREQLAGAIQDDVPAVVES